MARLFDGTNFLLRSAAPVTGVPLAMACWFNSDDATIQQVFIVVHNFGLPIESFGIEVRGNIAGDYLYAGTTTGSVDDSAITTTGYSVDTWHHGCGIFATPTDRRAFIDGGSKGTDSGSSVPSGIDYTNYGVIDYGAGEAGYMSGMIAEGGIWDLSVWPGASDTDRADNFETVALPGLSAGYSPLFFPLGLVEYRKLVRDEDYDEITGNVMSTFGSPGFAPHLSNIIYPSRTLYGIPSAEAEVERLPVLYKPIRRIYAPRSRL